MSGQHHVQSGSSLAPALAGAVLGVAGLAWWLLSEAERRRTGPRRQRTLRFDDALAADDGLDQPTAQPRGERELHDKVHELNQAIDDVRRQLESMGSR